MKTTKIQSLFIYTLICGLLFTTHTPAHADFSLWGDKADLYWKAAQIKSKEFFGNGGPLKNDFFEKGPNYKAYTAVLVVGVIVGSYFTAKFMNWWNKRKTNLLVNTIADHTKKMDTIENRLHRKLQELENKELLLTTLMGKLEQLMKHVSPKKESYDAHLEFVNWQIQQHDQKEREEFDDKPRSVKLEKALTPVKPRKNMDFETLHQRISKIKTDDNDQVFKQLVAMNQNTPNGSSDSE